MHDFTFASREVIMLENTPEKAYLCMDVVLAFTIYRVGEMVGLPRGD